MPLRNLQLNWFLQNTVLFPTLQCLYKLSWKRSSKLGSYSSCNVISENQQTFPELFLSVKKIIASTIYTYPICWDLPTFLMLPRFKHFSLLTLSRRKSYSNVRCSTFEKSQISFQYWYACTGLESISLLQCKSYRPKWLPNINTNVYSVEKYIAQLVSALPSYLFCEYFANTLHAYMPLVLLVFLITFHICYSFKSLCSAGCRACSFSPLQIAI